MPAKQASDEVARTSHEHDHVKDGGAAQNRERQWPDTPARQQSALAAPARRRGPGVWHGPAVPARAVPGNRLYSCQRLNRVLADTQILYALYKKHHWLMRGETFYQLHLLLDKHAGEQLELVDTIAERVQTLGGVAVGDPRHVAEITAIPRPPNGVEEVPATLMVTPATEPEQIKAIAGRTRGFLYVMSVMATTGSPHESASTSGWSVAARARRHSPRPVLIGFGIDTPARAAAAARHADGVAVGSALMRRVLDGASSAHIAATWPPCAPRSTRPAREHGPADC